MSNQMALHAAMLELKHISTKTERGVADTHGSLHENDAQIIIRQIEGLELKVERLERELVEKVDQLATMERDMPRLIEQRDTAVGNMQATTERAQKSLSDVKRMGQNAVRFMMWMMLTLGRDSIQLDREVGKRTADYDLKSQRDEAGNYSMMLEEKVKEDDGLGRPDSSEKS